jgi:hypothetical protein
LGDDLWQPQFRVATVEESPRPVGENQEHQMEDTTFMEAMVLINAEGPDLSSALPPKMVTTGHLRCVDEITGKNHVDKRCFW